MASTRSIATCSLLAALPVFFAPSAQAAWNYGGVKGLVGGDGHYYVSIPDGTATGGISHTLDPNLYFAFRVHIKHADADHPEIGWWSDSFTPTSANVQICDVTGCEANSIDAGTQNLNWSDLTKVTIELQYKTGQLAPWQSQVVTLY